MTCDLLLVSLLFSLPPPFHIKPACSEKKVSMLYTASFEEKYSYVKMTLLCVNLLRVALFLH